jgi:hypothetical protein
MHRPSLSRRFALLLALALPGFFLTGCITHRTVTQNGRVVAEGPAIKRPVRDAIVHSRR